MKNFALLLFFLINSVLYGLDTDWGFSYKEYAFITKSPDIDGEVHIENTPYAASFNSVGTVFSLSQGVVELNVSYYINATIESASKVLYSGTPGLFNGIYRCYDIKEDITDNVAGNVTGIKIRNNLNLLNLVFSPEFADITIGRQIIGWGSGKFTNPTDIIAPLNNLDVADDVRQGVDAVRAEIYAGNMNLIDMGFISGDEFAIDKSAYYLRGESVYKGYKIAPLLMRFWSHNMIGLDINGSLKDAAVWFEGAYVLNEYIRANIGMEYVFINGSYLETEYIYNGCGETNDSLYDDAVSDKFAYREGRVYLMGKHYFDCVFYYPITPLFDITFSGIVNLIDYSVYAGFNFNYSLSDNVSLFSSVFYGIGDNPKIITVEGELFPQIYYPQEFGLYPLTFVLGFSIYNGS